jgi:hypothetical protein
MIRQRYCGIFLNSFSRSQLPNSRPDGRARFDHHRGGLRLAVSPPPARIIATLTDLLAQKGSGHGLVKVSTRARDA